MKKFKLLKRDFKFFKGIKVYRIQALKDFGDVKAGDLGGYVSSVSTLSDLGNCWIDDDSIVCSANGECQVWNNSVVKNSLIYEGNICASSVKDSKLYNCWIYESTVNNCELNIVSLTNCSFSIIKDFGYTLSGLKFKDLQFDNVDFGSFKLFQTKLGRKVLFYQDMLGKIRVVVGCQSGITLEEFEEQIYTKYYDDDKEEMYESYKDLPLHRKEYLEMIECAKRIYQLRKED